DQQIRFRMGYKSEVGASSKLIFNFFDSSLDLRLEAYQRALEGENRIRRASGTENIDTAATAAQKSQLTLTLPLWDSASIVGSAAYNQYKKYNFAVLNEDGTILQDYLTDVKQVVFQGGGTISFADWIRLVGTYAVSDNTYLEQSSKDEEFRRRNPDNVVDSTIYMEIGKTF
ncbi:MAG: hypothetical protein NTX25_19765, partial [Proteobacteria bacterium]|nr:hypothetical protein [Pseudomonadota bacterium]